MFNLLVSYSGWTPPKGKIPKGRFLTQTNQNVLDLIRPAKIPNLEAISKLKTLFMPEIHSLEAEPFGRIGTVQNIVDNADEYIFDFYYDESIEPIPVDQIEEMSNNFGGVVGFGLSNTHWSVKDSDLFELLYRKTLHKTSESHPFRLSELPIKERQIGLMMPFDTQFDVVRDAIFEFAESLNCTCLRADNVWQEDVLIQDIINLIIESKVIICDATGRNPNVFYEAGIAHALRKKVILITQNADDIPFDLKHLRYVQYLGNEQGINQLVNSLRDRVTDLINTL